MRHSFKGLILAVLAVLFITSSMANACTGLQVKTTQGQYVNGRTVEFGVPLKLSGLVVPRHFAFTGTLPDGHPGLHYRAKYAVIGSSVFHEPAVVDGLNEKGLSVGVFYFPGYAKYAKITKQNQSYALSPTEFSNWLLTQFANVEEVKKHLAKVVIAPTVPKGWSKVPPVHYVVYDRSGKSIVIEPIAGKLKVYDNPLGVITNSPTFDWHMTNVANYINLSPLNIDSKKIAGVEFKAFGQGTGLRGLPGDFTPPSRFVRAVLFAANAEPVKETELAVLQVFHLLNQFDIPYGSVRAQQNASQADRTIATTVKDPEQGRYYFRTYDDQTIRVINMKALDLTRKALYEIPYSAEQLIVNVTAKATKRK